MPKALSLKKNIPKNQKPITQFFKNTPHVGNIVSPENQKSEVSIELKSNKRKILSPTNCNQNEDRNLPNDSQQGNIISKKLKIVENNYCNRIKNGEEINGALSKKGLTMNKCRKLIFEDEKGKICDTPVDSNKEIINIKSCKENICQKEDTNFNKLKLESKIVKSPSKCPVQKEEHYLHVDNQVEEVELDKDEFGEEWDIDGIESGVENLDLSNIQRCQVLSVKIHPKKLELKLKNSANEIGTCFVEGIWLNTPLQAGEIVSVMASRDSSGNFTIGNSSGLLVLRPDHLISATSVVAGVFCKRKAVLQERWRGIDSANTAMTIGTMIHELVQKALTERISSLKELQKQAESIITDSIQMLYDAGLSEEEALTNMQMYLPPLAEFMQTYVVGNSKTEQNMKDKWNGKVDEVLDIEENVCCHQLGLKGKIDATLRVTIHDKKGKRQETVPLELKSGRASASAEHRGQLVLYGMMLALQRGGAPATDHHSGLLLYLKERVDLREISCGYPERRDLIMLRNELAQHLAPGLSDVDTDQIGDIEDAPQHFRQSLPEPVHNERACTKCPYLTICSLHLWHSDETKVSETHPLAKLRSEALGHLTPEHIKYFLRWTSLLLIEEKTQMSSSPLHALWTEAVEKRSKRGACAANLKLKSVSPTERRYLHIFLREQVPSDVKTIQSKVTKGPQEGEFSIVSVDNRPWVAAGVITKADDSEIQILLERDLSRRLDTSALFHIDTYESYSSTVQNLTNLGVLMEDSERALTLRKFIIDKEEPVFAEKLPRTVGRAGLRLLRGLNVEQQRAVLRAVAAQQYVLLQGLPGTGKTQTISVLIQLLAALGWRVLVTAHAHAAVDNVLARLPASLRVMRLGGAARVSAAVRARTEGVLTAACTTPEQLRDVYDSMEVVGVTCLGAAHAMLARTTFDVCIVDEATQVLQSTVVRALAGAARFVLAGDPHQLPPVVRSPAARRLGMEESLFHRLMRPSCTCTLRLQYRMCRPLADLANRVAYDGQLRCANDVVALATIDIHTEKLPHFSEDKQWLKIACSTDSKDAAIFFDLDLPVEKSTEKSLTNPYEVSVVMALTETLITGGVEPSDIGVIAPYREQVSLLRRSLARSAAARTEVSTVDQFQGRDKSVIIYSATRRLDDTERKVKDGEVLNDQRRLAVSVTRAKHKLLVVGSERALRRDLSRRLDTSALFHIDTYESYSSTVQNLTNLGVLMEDSERALTLRKFIIDKEEPVFAEKLPRTVGRAGLRLLRGLNIEQQRAVLRAVAAQQYVLLQGLPGTGKTQTISVLIQLLAALGRRVLVTAHAHAAVDNVLARLPASLRVMRLGGAARVSAAVRARTEGVLTAACTTPEQLRDVYDSMEVVGVTCLGAAHAMLARTTFDVCIVDEATQVLQSTVVRALAGAARFVLAGDPHQLPPVVRSPAARRLGMEESLFHRLMRPSCTCTLRLQYRMCRPLADLANRVAYDGQLRCANDVVALATIDIHTEKLPHFSEDKQWLKIACSTDSKDAAIFFDLDLPVEKSTEKSLTNPYEVSVVMALTETLITGGVEPSDIGVIAPYREQVSLLRRSLARSAAARTEVSTVDQFQGRDKSVIIYSATRRLDDTERKVKDGEVLNDQRRLAVSVTRAKHKLLVVGSERALRRYAPLSRLITECQATTLQMDTIHSLYTKYGHLIT